MKCPQCQSQMQQGKLRFTHPTFFGTHYEAVDLTFVDAEGEQIVPKLGVAAHFCASCHTVVAAGAYENERLKCFECHRDIDEGADACPHCGWTWR